LVIEFDDYITFGGTEPEKTPTAVHPGFGARLCQEPQDQILFPQEVNQLTLGRKVLRCSSK
jgi:hypothetical protein